MPADTPVTMPIVTSPEQNVSEVEIEQAIRSGIERYFDDCRARVPAFIDRHFHYPGAVATNRVQQHISHLILVDLLNNGQEAHFWRDI